MQKSTIWILAIIAALVVIVVIVKYNYIVSVDEQVRTAYTPLGGVLKERYDSIPRLVPALELYAGMVIPEAVNLKKIAATFDAAKTIAERIHAANTIEDALQKTKQHMADRYPGILSNNQVDAIVQQMKSTIEKMKGPLEAYNKLSDVYNTYVRRFPNDLIALIFGYANKYEYLQPQL